MTYAYLACYPTTAANARADYTLPGGVVVPRMQRGAEAPILPGSPSRLPVLVYSHGYGGSPLDGNYLSALVAFASWGYVTLAPFHGDLRYSVFGPDALSSQFYIPVWDEFVAMQAIASSVGVRGARCAPNACRVARPGRHGTDRRVRHQPGRRNDCAARAVPSSPTACSASTPSG